MFIYVYLASGILIDALSVMFYERTNEQTEKNRERKKIFQRNTNYSYNNVWKLKHIKAHRWWDEVEWCHSHSYTYLYSEHGQDFSF